MKQIFYFLITFIGGLLLHQTASITLKMPNGWQHLTGPVIGVQGTFPFYVMFLKRLGLDNDKIFKASLAYQVVFLLVGCGVAFGWMLDTIFGIDRITQKTDTEEQP